jgi:proteasome lid subunit RPN8/RPN11
MELAISRALLDEIRAHAAEEPDREVCGLLLGHDAQVRQVCRCRNVAGDPARRFEIDPAALIAAYRAARSGAPGLIGHYHSHPAGQAIPSACDAEMADPGSFWLIIAGPDIRCWWSVAGGEVENMFARVRIC